MHREVSNVTKKDKMNGCSAMNEKDTRKEDTHMRNKEDFHEETTHTRLNNMSLISR